LKAFDQAIDETMTEIEANASTRVRTNGKNENRTTGNLIWGKFTHEEARPVGGLPDPHLHQHVFIFNATYDEKKRKLRRLSLEISKQMLPIMKPFFIPAWLINCKKQAIKSSGMKSILR
jgi:conjugative relaxase-like TrwC/TraI family protein